MGVAFGGIFWFGFLWGWGGRGSLLVLVLVCFVGFSVLVFLGGCFSCFVLFYFVDFFVVVFVVVVTFVWF